MTEEEFNELLQKANNNDAKAQSYLGKCYSEGLFVDIDYNKALFWLNKALEQDECEAYNRLGVMYYYGFGVISAEGQFIEDSSGTISLGPVILKNGQIAIGFIGIKETDPMGFGLMAYTDEFMDEVYTYKAILDCVLYK